jgi:hypothetical protein
MNYKYIVVKEINFDNIRFEDVAQTSMNTSRMNKERTCVLLKFSKKCPKWHVNEPIYSYEQILKVLINGEW